MRKLGLITRGTAEKSLGRTLGLVVLAALLFLGSLGTPLVEAQAGSLHQAHPGRSEKALTSILSPYWPSLVQQWSPEIKKVSDLHGIDPDLIAAVIQAESGGNPDLVSRMGAVGLMGVMSAETGFQWRPSSEELGEPGLNLRWGVAILAEIIRQAGGDVHSALAAYNGGWGNAARSVPQTYADDVLDMYARAVLTRAGEDHSIAAQWTIAVRMNRGYVPDTDLLVLGDQPLSDLFLFAEHTVFYDVDAVGDGLFVQGYVVPVALVVPTTAVYPEPLGESDTLNPSLSQRLGLTSDKERMGNPRVILACLPSLSRLRGKLSTRWYAPSSCPAWHR